jgi:hypothetical protein
LLLPDEPNHFPIREPLIAIEHRREKPASIKAPAILGRGQKLQRIVRAIMNEGA